MGNLVFLAQKPKWDNLAPDPHILENFRFCDWWMHHTYTLLKSPYLFLEVVESLIYKKFGVFGPKPKTG